MKLTPALTKAITETKYLSVDNHARYRLIMRLFYINHERINYWLNVNDVYSEVSEHISGYTIDDCRQDLQNLVEWGNLINDLDTDNIFKIQDFKNKKFRYQMSDYSVEIERLTVMLENMNVEGSSLDVGLIGTIRAKAEQMREMAKSDSAEELYTWWRSLSESFKRLNREYQDYMKSFSYLNREDNSSARQFIAVKDDIIKYLRTFVKGIQRDGTAIGRILEECEDVREQVLERVIDYENSIPRVSGSISRESISEDIYSKYNNMYKWFTGGGESGIEHILSVTNSVIRSLTGYASVLAENINSMASRRDEYRLYAEMFMGCESMDDAHRLSALLFGISNTCHIAADAERQTDSINSGIYDEPPEKLTIKPRVTTYREKQKQSAIKDRTMEKRILMDEYIREAEKGKKLIESLITDGKIVIAELPEISAAARGVLLSWISGAMSRTDADSLYKTEYGWEFTLRVPEPGNRAALKCEDGELIMPAFVLEFGELS